MRGEGFIYYLHEPPDDPPNTILNGAMQPISRKILYTTSASFPSGGPILLISRPAYRGRFRGSGAPAALDQLWWYLWSLVFRLNQQGP